MITHEDIQPGTHCWALNNSIFKDSILVVLKISENYYEVCGPWEGIIEKEMIEIISIINKPEGYEDMDLYFKNEIKNS